MTTASNKMPARRKAAKLCILCKICGICITCEYCACIQKRKAYRPSKAQVEAAVKVFMQAPHPDASVTLWMRRALIAADKVRVEEAENG